MNLVMRYPGGRQLALTLSYDDGVKQDVRLIEIMTKHGLKGTFNLNAGFLWDGTGKPVDDKRTLTVDDMKRLYIPSGNEVALHTYTHPTLTDLQPHHVCSEVLRDRARLEDIFGVEVRGMAYPNGLLNDKVVDCVKSCGIAYARTTISSETFNITSDWLRLPATCHHNNPRLFELFESFQTITGYAAITGPCRLFYLWGHSYEFDINNNWDRIERFAEVAGGREDIWYATNIEIYNYVQAFGRLRYNMACTKAYNPTSTDLWIAKDGVLLEIKAGSETDI